MSLQGRLEMLDARHQNLESIISEEMRHPAFDEIRLADLKRQKLRIKDEIEQLRRHTDLKSHFIAAE